MSGWWLTFRRDESRPRAGNGGGIRRIARCAARSLRSIAICSSSRGEFRRAAIVAGADGKIEQAFQDGRVSRGALQHGFQQIDRFLRQTVTGKQIDIGQSLRDVTLRFFVERRFGRRGSRTVWLPLPREPVSPAGEISPDDRFKTRLRAQAHIFAPRGFVFRSSFQQLFVGGERLARHPPKLRTRARAEPAHPAAGTNRWPCRRDRPAIRVVRVGLGCAPRAVRSSAPEIRGRPSRSSCRESERQHGLRAIQIAGFEQRAGDAMCHRIMFSDPAQILFPPASAAFSAWPLSRYRSSNIVVVSPPASWSGKDSRSLRGLGALARGGQGAHLQ